jgi:hypothetical protein
VFKNPWQKLAGLNHNFRIEAKEDQHPFLNIGKLSPGIRGSWKSFLMAFGYDILCALVLESIKDPNLLCLMVAAGSIHLAI